MIDVFAALDLAIAASKTENSGQLFDDAKRLYGMYQKSKTGTLDIKKMPSADLKATIEAASRILNVANVLVTNPGNLSTLENLLASIQ